MSLRLSREAKSQLDDIRKACRVSSDDTGIARHFRVPLYEVQAIRLDLPEHDAFERRVRPEAVASAELLEAVNAAVVKWGHRFGCPPHEAREMLFDWTLNGEPIANVIARLREAA